MDFNNLSDVQLRAIIRKAALNTGGDYGTSGLMSPEQANKFLDLIYDDSSFLASLRHERKTVKQGTISKLGVGSRLLRGFKENTDNVSGHEVTPTIGEMPYDCKKMVLGSAITEDWFQDNKEREGFENHFFGLIATQIQLDMLDLAFNGDEAATLGGSLTADDVAFLRMNDGFIKQIRAKGNVVDGVGINSGAFSKQYFYDLKRAVPAKYRNSKFKWICSDNTYTDMSEYLSERATGLGDLAVVSGKDMKVLDTPFTTVPMFPDDIIMYTDPYNLTVVNTMDIKHRKTTEGKTALYEDKRFYADILNADFIIMEPEATGILINKGKLA
jgi:hypothetical protein